MSFLNKLTALLPFGKKEEILEYFFALNITQEKLTSALWTIEGKHLKISGLASESYSSLDELTPFTDKLLDESLGIREIEPQKILFGVPSAWLSDENLKDDDLKVLRKLVKELDLKPMAYVENSHALVHFLDKQEGVPTTAVLVGFETHRLTVTVVRAGKLDGVKIVSRAENSGADIEKALLSFIDVKTLPSKILIYGSEGFSEPSKAPGGLKDQLLSFPWMSKLSFLHFPKIEILQDDVEIKSVCFAGASEIEDNVVYTESSLKQNPIRSSLVTQDTESTEDEGELNVAPMPSKLDRSDTGQNEDLGFMVGDILSQEKKEENIPEERATEESLVTHESRMVEIEDFEHELPAPAQSDLAATAAPEHKLKKGFPLGRFIPRKRKNIIILSGIAVCLLLFLAAYIILPKADVKIFVEPKILENDTQVTADPTQKTVDENAKIIPGQIIATDISGSAKDTATGKKEIGDPSKGTIKIINNSGDAQTFSKGSVISSNSIKFTLDSAVNVASTSAVADSKSTANATVTAVNVGADGNLPSGTQFTGLSTQVATVAEGNFSGGTSKEVTVVSSADQQRLLAKLSSDLRQLAQQKLQEQFNSKKVLQEALLENIVKKSYSKSVNDQANEFSLDLSVHYKGTAFDDTDLKSIVSKLVTTQVPDGFTLDLSDTETQADVAKLDKDGKLIFLARFKAKMLPKIDTDKVKDQIKGKSVTEAEVAIKGIDNVLGSEIKISPNLPAVLQRIPFFAKNITIEVGLK